MIKICDITVGPHCPLLLIAGPCVIENREFTLRMAEKISAICRMKKFPLIFKASFDKANRTSNRSFRGIGMAAALEILQEVRNRYRLPVLTDIHSMDQAKEVSGVVDVIQIPAFLSRQTDILQAAGRSGCAVNIKKGQFLSPWDMAQAAEKIVAVGNRRILLTERGTTFGYRNLVVDFRSLPIMAETGFPVIFDATHSVQIPGGLGNCSDGLRQYVRPLARAAVAVGCSGLFLEVHEEPDNAPCDGPNMVNFEQFSVILDEVRRIHDVLIEGKQNG